MKKYWPTIILLFLGFIGQPQTPDMPKDSLLKKLDSIFVYDNAFQFAKVIKKGKELSEMSKKAGLDSITAEAHYAVGMSYESVKKYDKAFENYKTALHYAEVCNDSVFMFIINNGLGNISVLNKKDYEKSNQYYRHALELSRKVAPDYSAAMIGNLCWNFVENGNPEKVKPFIPEIKTYLATTEPSDFNRSNFLSKLNHILGQYYSANEDYKEAQTYFDESIRIASEYNLLESLKNSYRYRAESYAAQGKFEKAYADIQESHFYKEEYLNAEAKDQLAIQEKSAELEKNEKALEASKRENDLLDKLAQNRKLAIYAIAAVTLILIVFLIVLNRGNRTRKNLIAALNKQNDQLKKTQKEAEEASEIKNQFISNISHEIRTPMHGVIGITDLLLGHSKMSKENKKLLKSLKFSGKYLLNLINNVLMMTKINNHKIKVIPKDTKVDVFIDNLKNACQFTAEKSKCNLVFDVDKDLPKSIRIDHDLLYEILVNLMDNAIKYSDKGQVKVSLKIIDSTSENIKIRFVVQDEGPGIPFEQQRMIFEKFSQIERDESVMQGTGLGLSIVLYLLNILGSRIHLESELNRGATFYFDLECMRPKDKSQTLKTALEKIEGKRILLVEDNKINELVIKKFLEPLYTDLTSVVDGKEGCELLLNGDFDLALIDINIPSMNGYEVTRHVRKQNITIPIIAVTAADPEGTKERAKKAGLDGFIIKPFSKAKLYQILEKHLNETPQT